MVRAATLLAVSILALTPPPAAAQSGTRSGARSLVQEALDAMGGEARWRGLRSLRLEGMGHRNALEQSERPEGPWIPTYVEFAELQDLEGTRLRRTEAQRGFWSAQWRPSTLVADGDAAARVAGERWAPGTPGQQAGAVAGLVLSPARVLLTALDAPDLAQAADTVVQGVPHAVLTFSALDRRVRLFLNRQTRLPTGFAVPAPEGDFFAEIWGDEPTVTLWSLWSLEPGGWLFPRQEDRYRLGQPLERTLLSSVTFQAPAPADSFAVPEAAREAFHRAAASGTFRLSAARPGISFQNEPQEAQELAPGVITIAGRYATTFVAQDDGVVILEAPMTSAWSRAVLDEAARRFPGLPVKAVVTTSDAWLHLGGLRTYAARGIPIVALDLNVPLVERLLAAPRDRDPDALARNPRPAHLTAVRDSLVLGTGASRLVLHPIRGEGGERMLAAWLPEHRILYASDLVQIQPDGNAFWPEYLAEVAELVARAGLEPERVFAMHTPPTPWARLQQLLAEARSTTAPGR